MKTRSVFIECREWRDQVNGNTYSTSEIHVNGWIIARQLIAYGDATQRLYEAKKLLIVSGNIPEITHFSELAALGIDFYTVTSRVKKNQLHRSNN